MKASPSQSQPDKSPTSDARHETSQSSGPDHPATSNATPAEETSHPDNIRISCYCVFYKFKGKTYGFDIKATSLEEADERIEAIRAGAVLDPGHRGWGPFEMANMLRDLLIQTNAKRMRADD